MGTLYRSIWLIRMRGARFRNVEVPNCRTAISEYGFRTQNDLVRPNRWQPFLMSGMLGLYGMFGGRTESPKHLRTQAGEKAPRGYLPQAVSYVGCSGKSASITFIKNILTRRVYSKSIFFKFSRVLRNDFPDSFFLQYILLHTLKLLLRDLSFCVTLFENVQSGRFLVTDLGSVLTSKPLYQEDDADYNKNPE